MLGLFRADFTKPYTSLGNLLHLVCLEIGKGFFWPGWERCGSANGGLNKEARDASASRKFRIKFA